MKSIGKSLLLAFAGTGLLFFFLMTLTVPTMALLARIGGNISQKSVVVDPAGFLRFYGLPIAAVVFVAVFVVSMYRFRHAERHALAARSSR